MVDKLFALVELSFVDTHTLLWGQEQLRHDKFVPLFKTLLACHKDFQNLVFLIETITLYQLCDDQQSYFLYVMI